MPSICNSLELEPVILYGICYMLECLPSILRGICDIFGTSHLEWYLLHVGSSHVHVGFFGNLSGVI